VMEKVIGLLLQASIGACDDERVRPVGRPLTVHALFL
jgi:hypothetical protein